MLTDGPTNNTEKGVQMGGGNGVKRKKITQRVLGSICARKKKNRNRFLDQNSREKRSEINPNVHVLMKRNADLRQHLLRRLPIDNYYYNNSSFKITCLNL